MIILEGKGLSKRYTGHNSSVDALCNVSIELNEGEILGVVGESGSGKSTLLRILSGLERADRGQIFLFNKDVSYKRTKEDYSDMQMIFQDSAGSFHPRRKISSSIMEAVKNLTDKGEKFDMEALVAPLGLSVELANRYPRHLSGGQCQRFAIARAVSVNPKILLCDEITSALDVSSQAQILSLLSSICHERGMSAVFVSHDLAVVSCICDRVMVMRGGSTVETGSVKSIIKSPEQEYTKQLIASVL